jgi:hypothetical protein
MTTVVRNTDLRAQSAAFDLWETCAAAGEDVVVYTGNAYAACSLDGGQSFSPVNPNSLCTPYGESLCCDQVVIYAPSIRSFLWLIQTNAGNYVLGVASPDELRNSNGLAWTTYLIPADRFGGAGASMDFPEVAVGDHYLYVAFNLVGGDRGQSPIGLRLALSTLAERATTWLTFFRATGTWWMRPVQSPGDTGYFVVLSSLSKVRVYSWPENASVITWRDVPVATIPDAGFPTRMPSGGDWLGDTSKIGAQILGATRAGGTIWVAWNGARRSTEHPELGEIFPYPQIGLAMMEIGSWAVTQRYVWNGNHAFAWPALATNARGDVGLSFCWGGAQWDPQHGVAMLTGPNQVFQATTGGLTQGAGGHYISIRALHPSDDQFCASGFNQPRPVIETHPHYVIFGP